MLSTDLLLPTVHVPSFDPGLLGIWHGNLFHTIDAATVPVKLPRKLNLAVVQKTSCCTINNQVLHAQSV